MGETLIMSNPEIDKLKVIQNVINKKLTWPEASDQLDLSIRQVGTLVARVRQAGNKGIIHRLRGKLSNHRLKPGLLQKAMGFVKKLYPDFGPTFANEKLKSEHGIYISTFTLRQSMIAADLWTTDPTKPTHRSWRPRRACVGELIQLDGSDHDWFEGRGPRCVLVIYIDDATSRILYGEFVSVENTFHLMRTTRAYLERHGRPLALYVDKDSVYTVNRPQTLDEQLLSSDPLTQFARAMKELDIEIINAHSPQAKGRVERGFRTHQDRLVKELRLRGISSIEEANRFLWKIYIPDHNRRCAVEPRNPADSHRPLLPTHTLDRIFSIQEKRVVANDFTLRLDNSFFQILKEQSVLIRPKHKVLIEHWLDGSFHLWFENQPVHFKPLKERPYTPYYATKKVPVASSPSKSYKPPPSHPWKALSYKRMLLKKRGVLGYGQPLFRPSNRTVARSGATQNSNVAALRK